MKKKFILVFILLVGFLVFKFSIQIGNVRIGKQLDMVTKQNSNFENSNFNQKYFSKPD